MPEELPEPLEPPEDGPPDEPLEEPDEEPLPDPEDEPAAEPEDDPLDDPLDEPPDEPLEPPHVVTNAQEAPSPDPGAPASEVPPATGDPLQAVASESKPTLIQALIISLSYAAPGLRLPQGGRGARESERAAAMWSLAGEIDGALPGAAVSKTGEGDWSEVARLTTPRCTRVARRPA